MVDPQTYTELLALNAEYASVVDLGDWDRWTEMFTEECIYKIQPRENYDRGFPLATLAFESKGMLKDRVYGIRETLFHDPYYQRHVVGPVLIRSATAEEIEAEVNYAVFRTKPNELPTVFNIGRYLDRIRRTPEGLKFSARLCIYDSEMIANSIIYPI